jgi:hypothetical protein
MNTGCRIFPLSSSGSSRPLAVWLYVMLRVPRSHVSVVVGCRLVPRGPGGVLAAWEAITDGGQTTRCIATAADGAGGHILRNW